MNDTSIDQDALTALIASVSTNLGDVITEDMSRREQKDNCWALCIDAANEMFSDYPTTWRIKLARRACRDLGYRQ